MVDLSGIGLPSFEWGEVFHVGVRVVDLELAQRELTETAGVRWTSAQRIPMKVWAPGKDHHDSEITISLSVEGPVHIELVHGTPGSFWDASAGGPGLHHIGVWVDDVTSVNAELVRRGWVVELADRAPEEGYGGFTYTRSPAGLLWEPVSSRAGTKERFERWYAGGSLF